MPCPWYESGMALDSTSTREEAVAQYFDNMGYDIESSTTKCVLFIEACRYLLGRPVTRSEKSGESVELDIRQIENRLKSAEAWWLNNQTLSAATSGRYRVTHVDMRNFRV